MKNSSWSPNSGVTTSSSLVVSSIGWDPGITKEMGTRCKISLAEFCVYHAVMLENPRI